MAKTSDEPPSGCEEHADSQATRGSLLDGLRAGDRNAWARMDGLYRPLVCFWCRNWNVPSSEVEDLCQEVFAEVADKRLEKFNHQGLGSFRAWLRGVSRNLVLAYRRRAAGRPIGEGGTDANLRLQNLPANRAFHPDELPEVEDPPHEISSLYQRAMAVIRGEFSERDFLAALRFIADDLPARQVGEEFDMSAQTVRKAVSRIRLRLAEILGDG